MHLKMYFNLIFLKKLKVKVKLTLRLFTMKPSWLLKPTDSILTENGKSYIYIKNVESVKSVIPFIFDKKVEMKSPESQSQQ